MKTSFDLPEPLLRRAKAAAAQQGRPLRELVAEVISENLEGKITAAPQRRAEPPPDAWSAYLATRVRQPDGSYVNPNGIEDDHEFFKALDEIRHSRLSGQARLFPAPDLPARAPRRKTA